MAKVVESFWKNKSVFLTGHTGFKGAWLAIWLHKMGARVTGYALPPTSKPSLFEACKVGNLIESNLGDINNYESISRAIKKSQPDIVMHLAAQALVKYSYDHPIETYQTNVMGTVHVLQACRQVETIKSIVNITSDKCYENFEKQEGYKEDEPMGGFDPYSNSKGCAELVTSAFRKSFYSSAQVGLASARAGNVIGGGDWAADRLMPDIIKALSQKKPVIIRNPKAVRPWQHVLEPLSGYLFLAQKLYENPSIYSEAFNFGPHDEDAKPVQYIVEKAVKKWGADSTFSVDNNYKGPHEAHYLRLNIDKAKSVLKWQPSWNLDQALDQTIEWYRQYQQNPTGVMDVTLNQINQFERVLN